MRKIYLHIGPHKTASTFIQKQLYDNSKQLKELGYTYPLEGINIQWGHHNIAESYYTQKYVVAKKIIDQLKEDNVILSSENFDRLSQTDIERLNEDLKSFEVTVIFVKRNLSDVLISSWQESVKHGSFKSWSKYCFEHILRPFDSEVLNVEKILANYTNIFGSKNIKIIDYDAVKENGEDLFDIFVNCIGIEQLKCNAKSGKINISMSYTSVEILRALNYYYFKEYKKTPHHFVREAYIKYKNQADGKEIVAKLMNLVSENIENVDPHSSFILTFLEKKFNQHFAANYFNSPSDENTLKIKYALPGEFSFVGAENQLGQVYKEVKSLMQSNS